MLLLLMVMLVVVCNPDRSRSVIFALDNEISRINVTKGQERLVIAVPRTKRVEILRAVGHKTVENPVPSKVMLPVIIAVKEDRLTTQPDVEPPVMLMLPLYALRAGIDNRPVVKTTVSRIRQGQQATES